ncbi:MAG: LacI family DNA-binding transcriptional regulator, partial [Blautia sp.]|nr:LacI family DNA-binding transcriptional regulator [Blautia sp.]
MLKHCSTIFQFTRKGVCNIAISAKELAKRLNLSAVAVSMALNDKPGVSTKTRKRVKEAAERMGYDFSKIRKREIENGSFYFIIYTKLGAVVDDTPFFRELITGVTNQCKELGYKVKVTYLYEEDLNEKYLEEIQYSDCIGIILLGTEDSQYHQPCWWFVLALPGPFAFPPKGGLTNQSYCYWWPLKSGIFLLLLR